MIMNGGGKNIPDKGQKCRGNYLERKGNEDVTMKKTKKKRDKGRGREMKLKRKSKSTNLTKRN